jgi:hypothetical protein
MLTTNLFLFAHSSPSSAEMWVAHVDSSVLIGVNRRWKILRLLIVGQRRTLIRRGIVEINPEWTFSCLGEEDTPVRKVFSGIGHSLV